MSAPSSHMHDVRASSDSDVAREPPAEGRDLLRALANAVGLSLFFFAVYVSCNVITSRRSDVGHASFAWEQFIPFVPWMIVPYMSLDLFFFAAPFLCATRRERTDHARRLMLAMMIAGACFLLFPLTPTFTRPRVVGMFAPVFNFLYGFDRPYNLAPSLHIALRSLLWVVYVRHLRGLARAGVTVWFVLIGLSTVLTHQHQVIDVVTGQFLGLFCLHVFPDGSGANIGPRNLRVAVWYGFGAMLIGLVAYAARPWGLVLLWPAASLAIMAWAYFKAGPAVFRKRDGRLPLSTYIVLGPYLLGTRMACLWHARRDVPFSRVRPGLIIGRSLRAAEARGLIAGGVDAVLDLTAECGETGPFLGLAYLNVPILDLTVPTAEQLADRKSVV